MKVLNNQRSSLKVPGTGSHDIPNQKRVREGKKRRAEGRGSGRSNSYRGSDGGGQKEHRTSDILMLGKRGSKLFSCWMGERHEHE